MQAKQKLYFLKKIFNFRVSLPYLIQYEKCIQISTNKPSIGPVVLEIGLRFQGNNIVKFQFYTKITAGVECNRHFLHYDILL